MPQPSIAEFEALVARGHIAASESGLRRDDIAKTLGKVRQRDSRSCLTRESVNWVYSTLNSNGWVRFNHNSQIRGLRDLFLNNTVATELNFLFV